MDMSSTRDGEGKDKATTFVADGNAVDHAVDHAVDDAVDDGTCMAVGKQVSWDPASNAVLASTESMLSDELREQMTPSLFSLFWSLSLYDIYVPAKRYENELLKRSQEKTRKVRV